MGALAGFLWFNWPPARIFMGDAGSTFLGFFLGVRSLEDTVLPIEAGWQWALPLCILAVPWYDLTTVVTLRLWQGKSPFHADKQHLSHRLVALGLRSPSAVRVIYLLGMASGIAGLMLAHTSQNGAILVLLLLGVFWFSVAGIEYFRHFSDSASPPGA
jgi:UDP-GlcNAc:undecaprenyl-phosphate GlcNAc-1-phosphate transferase